MRILVIEDDKNLAYEMKQGLEKKGFVVDVANRGIEGEEKAYVTDYEAVLLDLNLPDKDGVDILRFLRAKERNIPIDAILDLLGDLGDIPSSLKEQITTQKDETTLRAWHKLAAKAESIEEFLSLMES